MVFYRKYRPQRIDDLDSALVRDTLHTILQKDIPHAFLFTGPKGLGKTSTARIVAKTVNCERVSRVAQVPRVPREEEKARATHDTLDTRGTATFEPCNECEQCISITSGTNIDVLEIDAASNRGIDEIRELKEKIRLAPVAAKRKVYIIDEVHMLTTEAFNALLKTLEEPPVHAMFILCTTEAHKVPDTIVSRCFQIQFRPATEKELVRSFKRIVAGEKIDITDESLQMIAGMADGGFRDGVKILEELFLLANGEKITKELIEKKYNLAGMQHLVITLIKALSTYDVKEALRTVIQISDQGTDIKYFLQQILEVLHILLLSKLEIQSTNLKLSDDLTIDQIKTLSELCAKAYSETKYAVLPQMPLELAIIEYCEEARNYEEQNAELNADPKMRLSDANRKVVQSGSAYSSASVSDLRKQVGTIKKLKAMYGDAVVKNETISDASATITTSSVELLKTAGDGTITDEWLDLFWKNLISEVKKYNHTVAGVLRGCTIKSFADQKLIIQTSYKFHKERLDDIKNREVLLQTGKLLTGKDIEITVELRS